jgi:hypothetical protein
MDIYSVVPLKLSFVHFAFTFMEGNMKYINKQEFCSPAKKKIKVGVGMYLSGGTST